MQQASSLEMGVNAMSLLAGTTSAELEQGRVLQLLNMVTAEELMDNDEYEGTSTDMMLLLFFILYTEMYNANHLRTFLGIRNLPRCPGRMREIRQSSRDQSPTTERRTADSRCRQDLCQVRRARVSAGGAQGIGR